MSPVVFTRSEDAAVSVDWIALTSAVIAVGTMAALAVRTGLLPVGGRLGGSMTEASNSMLEETYRWVGLTADLAEARRVAYRDISTEQIIGGYWDAVYKLSEQLESRQTSPTGDWSNLSAGETLDLLYLQTRELRRRDTYPVPGAPQFHELYAMYLARR